MRLKKRKEMNPRIVISDGRVAKYIFKALREQFGETGNRDLIVLGDEEKREDILVMGDFIKSVYVIDDKDNVIEVFNKLGKNNTNSTTEYDKQNVSNSFFERIITVFGKGNKRTDRGEGERCYTKSFGRR